MKLPAHLQAKIDAAKDIEAASLQLADDLKYPIDAHGRVLDMNHLPDVAVALIYHLIRCGWRPDPDKRLIKARRVIGGGYYEDLVTYVDVTASDAPLVVNAQPPQEVWSVKPTVTVTDEPRNP